MQFHMPFINDDIIEMFTHKQFVCVYVYHVSILLMITKNSHAIIHFHNQIVAIDIEREREK